VVNVIDQIKHEQNIHEEIFHPHAKPKNACIPIEMTQFQQ